MEIIKSREKYRGCNVTLNTDLVVKGFEDEIGKKGWLGMPLGVCRYKGKHLSVSLPLSLWFEIARI